MKNKFAGSELAKLADKAPHLQMLVLGENDIKEYSQIAPLAQLQDLLIVELMGTPLAEKDDYREKVFELFQKSDFSMA